ncbi:MAG: hypothetical protein OHK0015_07310 [Chloroflexi bacterium OHK40]
MQTWKRLIVALTIVLSGLLLVPFVALPHETFSWRLFAGAYGSAPVLTVNYPDGAPGSFFTITGYNFPAGQPGTIAANGVTLGSVNVGDTGSFVVIISTGDADVGVYRITASAGGGSASTRFELIAGAAERSREGDETLLTFSLPAGLAGQDLYLPLLKR